MPGGHNSTSINSIGAMLDVVESFLAAGSGQYSLSEIARGTGLTKNRVWRILNTLALRGYVQQDPITKQYSLGPGFLVLGEAFRNRTNLQKLVGPLLEEIVEALGDVATLEIRSGHITFCVDIRIGRNVVQAMPFLWESVPINIGATPKLLLVFASEKECAEIINDMEFNSSMPAIYTSRDAFIEELTLIHSQGYSISKDGLDYKSVSAPVRDHSGQVIAAISITTPDARYNEAWLQRAIELAVDASQRLSSALGYYSAP